MYYYYKFLWPTLLLFFFLSFIFECLFLLKGGKAANEKFNIGRFFAHLYFAMWQRWSKGFFFASFPPKNNWTHWYYFFRLADDTAIVSVKEYLNFNRNKKFIRKNASEKIRNKMARKTKDSFSPHIFFPCSFLPLKKEA